jgi:GNAT superfamily N-acetyltransferase
VLAVLDAHSTEWSRYGELVRRGGTIDFVRYLVILDRMTLRREARGFGIGLHVLARAIRTWAPADVSVVTLIAGPTENSPLDAATRLVVAQRLAAHWQALGFTAIRQTLGSCPMLYAGPETAGFEQTLRRQCSWSSPRPLAG